MEIKPVSSHEKRKKRVFKRLAVSLKKYFAKSHKSVNFLETRPFSPSGVGRSAMLTRSIWNMKMAYTRVVIRDTARGVRTSLL